MRCLLTIGHSSRSFDELVALCRAHSVQRIVDVRAFPGSRRYPHFGREPLQAGLASAGVDYVWRPSLGGRRHRPRGAPPSPWRVAAFAAYADYMHTPEFAAAAQQLVAEADGTSALMCAEAFPYQCHRRLISDWLELHGVAVEHILSTTSRERHRLTAFARLRDGDVHYELEPQLVLPGAG